MFSHCLTVLRNYIRQEYFYSLQIICLHKSKWFQVLRCNRNNLTVIYLLTFNNSKERILRLSLTIGLVSYPGHSLGVLTLCRDEFGVFNNPSRIGYKNQRKNRGHPVCRITETGQNILTNPGDLQENLMLFQRKTTS